MHEPLKPKTMNKRIFLLGYLLSICINACAWDILQAVGSRSAALGRCSVALCDFWSIQNNPAGIASYDNISIGISYENRFLLNELSYKNIAFLNPLKIGVIGISASQFGFRNYNENVISLAFAREFAPFLKIGLKLDYLFFRYSNEYDNIHSATFEIGISSQITENILIATYIFNPINVKIHENNKVPVIMRIGFSYYVNNDFMIISEIEENFEDNLTFRIGLEYIPIKKIFIRTGLQLNPALFTFGLGYNHKRYEIDISAQMSNILGASLQCSFIINIDNKNYQ